MSRNHHSSGGTGGVVASSRRDDRSGLLDIHALSSIIDAQRRGGASASSVALPTFGTPWALQEVKPAAPEPRIGASARTVVVGPDHRPLYVMIAALSVAVASLGAYVLMRPTPTLVVERAAVVAGAEVDGEGAEGDAAAKAEAEAEAKAKAEAEAEAEAAKLAAEAPADPSAEVKTDASSEVEAVRSRVPRPSRPGTPPKPTPKTDPKPTPKDNGVISVECVIDPSKCGNGKTKPRVDEGDGDGDPSSSKVLPAAPSSSQIREAMAVVKPQAKACGPRHGGTPGEKVRVKLSVVGSTGKVTSAQALDDHAGTALGKCVADALSKAELPKFGKPQAGVMYAITL